MNYVDDESVLPICGCGRGPVMVVSRPVSSRLNGSERYFVCLECALSAGNRFNFNVLKDQEARLKLQLQCIEIYSYFDTRYLELWINHFAFCSSKKAVWEILRNEKIIHCSLSFFYEKLRLSSMEQYLKEIASISVMSRIIQVLDIYDSYLENQISKIFIAAKNESESMLRSRI